MTIVWNDYLKASFTNRRSWLVLVLAVALVPFLAYCQKPEPVKIGFVGGLSGRVADLGVAGRNGAMLAVEHRNAAGGVNGHPVALIARDDAQDTEIARYVVAELIDLKVAAIVGPMTSSMAAATVAQATRARVVMMSPTVTTNELTAKDDYFFRVISPTRDYATKAALFQRNALGKTRFAAIYDLRNRAYTESWLGDFRAAFEGAGGKLARAVPFESGKETSLAGVVRQALADRPEGVVIIANSLDAALLAQQIRKLDDGIGLAGSEWTATERLLEMGGKAVEGMHITQFLNRQGIQPDYQFFRKEYIARFDQEPGFAGLAAYDAASVVLEALARKNPAQDLKEAILSIREFAGAQSPVVFDAHGDSFRKTYLTVVRDGQFHVIEPH